MKMQESSVLTDCLESLKHAAERYIAAACEADSDDVRMVLQEIALDRCQQQAAVFNLMHQMGLYETEPAEAAAVRRARDRYARVAQELEARHRRAPAEGDQPPQRPGDEARA